jgi:hypothetical protein
MAEDEDSVKAVGVYANKKNNNDDWDNFSDEIEGNSNRDSE